MIKFTAYLLALIKLTGLACVGILCAAVVYSTFSVITSRKDLGHVLWTVGLRNAAWFLWRELPKEAKPEDSYQDVLADHVAISSWVFECMGAKTTREQMPGYIADMFLVLKPELESVSLPREGTPNRQEHVLIQLSKTLSLQRIALRKRVQSAYAFWEITTIITISLGMLTTILVSMSSTEFGRGDGSSQRVIRVLAIVFPALGTAAAAVFAFYGAQGEWSQASRTLASITQLHGQMALGVWKLKCINAENEDDVKVATAVLEDWSKRYVDIQTISNAAGTANSTSSGNSPSSGKEGGGSGGQEPAPAGPAPKP